MDGVIRDQFNAFRLPEGMSHLGLLGKSDFFMIPLGVAK